MAENILEIIIRARDEASKNLKITDKELKNVGESVSKAGSKFLIAGTAMAAGLGLALKKAGDFQEQMSYVATMLGEQSEKYMPGFETAIKSMAVTYGQSTATLSKGLYDILSASISAEKAIAFLEVSVRAAEAGFVDAGLTADALTTVVNAYSLSADRAGDISDWFFAIVEKGKTTMAELAPTIGLVLPLSKQLGVSLEEVGASLTVMTRAGIKTDIAVTSLKAIMSAFLVPSKEMTALTNDWNFASSEAAIKQLGLAGVLERLTKVDSTRIPQLFKEKTALIGMLTIIDKRNEFMEDSISISERAGKTDEMLAKRQDNLNVQMRKLKETVNILMVDIGTTLIPVIKDLAERVVENIDKFRDFVGENEELIKNVAILAPAILLISGAFLKVVGSALKMVSVISKLIPLIKALGLTVGGIPAIIGMAVAAVALLTVEFIKAEKAVKESNKANEKYLEQVDKQIGKMKEWEGTHKGLLLVKAQLLQRGAEETSEDIKNLDLRIAKLKEKEGIESAASEAAAEAAAKEAEAKKGASEEITEAEAEAREKKLEAEAELNEALLELRDEDKELKLLALEEEMERYIAAGVAKTEVDDYGKEARIVIAEEETKKKKDLADKELQKKIAVAKHINDATKNFAKDAMNLAVKVANNALKNKKREYDNAVEMGTLTQEEADKLYQKDKEKFKIVQKAEAIVTGALGIARAYSSAMVLPPPLNIIVGSAQAALMAGVTALQISQINAAQHGAMVEGEQIVKVGEGGKKELILPLEDARTKAMLAGLFGGMGGGITINELNVTNEIAGFVGAENIDEILEQITEATKSGVTSALEMAQAIYNEGKSREELS